MTITASYLSCEQTGYFSSLICEYLGNNDSLRGFYHYSPDLKGIAKAIAERNNFPVDRAMLAQLLERQYLGLEHTEATKRNLALLSQEACYTICTAHQPNLLTGYLYFVYKILHAIKLADHLKSLHPDKHFVPIYYMGSEDNDLEELGRFKYEGKKYIWEADGLKGAVGRMNTASLKPLLNELFKVLGPPGQNAEELKQLLTEAYLQQPTIAAATRHLVHQLFGRYGLLILDPDEAGFKKSILPVLKAELLEQTSYATVAATTEQLSTLHRSQAYPRPINLFYLHDQLRERIEKLGDTWYVLNTDIHWNQEELLEELESHPERFSPNVILRGILQESILPNVSFIGGGSEVAYWLQLKSLFEQYNVFYPPLLLRQSALWIHSDTAKLRRQLGLSMEELFLADEELIRLHITRKTGAVWSIDTETTAIDKIMSDIQEKARHLDSTLDASAIATTTKIKNLLHKLEKKMYRAEKQNQEIEVKRIERLKSALFPNGNLQERTENFIAWYLQYGAEYFDLLLENILPEGNRFLIIEDTIQVD